MNKQRRGTPSEKYFGPMLAAAVVLAAAVRLTYVLTDRRAILRGDGFDYHLSAWRLADGLGYTSAIGDVGAQYAHHPPGWVTVLGVVSWFGGRTQQQHQLVGVAIGLGVVVLAGLIGRRYFNARIGIIAAVIAALYPGFWVLEGNMLSEPLGLLVLGALVLAMPGLRDRPTLRRSIGIGALCGVLALVRAEQLLLLFIVVAPVILTRRRISIGSRLMFVVASTLSCALVIAPWSIYNETRFKESVILSTNGGGQLLAGNCPRVTYRGERLGWYDGCLFDVVKKHPDTDRSQRELLARSAALDNISQNIGRLPVVVPARFGRLVAVFRPSQTVGWVAGWMASDTRPIWAWVVSYWVLLPLALVGTVHARRARAFLLPLLAPLAIVVVTVALSYGEPRSHTPSDLGVVVLAAVGVDRIAARARARASVVPTDEARELR